MKRILPAHGGPQLLELDLSELPASPDPGDPLAQLRARGRRLLRPTLRALHEAGEDSRVVGLIAKVGGPLPWAAMQELRLAVRAFATSGKPTVAYAEHLGEFAGQMGAYVLATAFEEIWLQPGGDVGLLGVGVEATFLRGALDRLGVVPEFEQRYEYKNAPDQLTRSDFTEAHREALDRLTASTFEVAVEQIAAGRKLSPDRVRELVDSGPRTAPEALRDRLVDRLGYRDEAYAALLERTGEADLLFADRWQPRRRLRVPRPHRKRVALVELTGPIVSGRSRPGLAGRSGGSDTVGAALRAAQRDEQVAAVVLRVDSPGGSAVASEVIWGETVRIRDSGKPLVVSMGDVAASGGYYVSCAADAILALPSTITGSIGVFGGKLVVNDLLERFGLTTGWVQQGERALMFSARRPFSEAERARLSDLIDAIYHDFVARVARGRGMTLDQVEAVARGRVWTGQDALGAGLVDQLGGLRDAVRIARLRAGLPEDAPVVRAGQVPLLARLGRPRNSEDPRALVSASVPALADLSRLQAGAWLEIPPIRLR